MCMTFLRLYHLFFHDFYDITLNLRILTLKVGPQRAIL